MPRPVLPSPATWSAGVIPAPLLRANVSDAVALLSSPPMFIGSQTTTAQSIPSSTITSVQLDTELYDNWTGHQIANLPSRYYANLAGWYLVQGSVPLNYSGGGNTLSATIGGQRVGNNASAVTGATVAGLLKMTNVGTFGDGDYIHLGVYQGTGSNRSLQNGASKSPYLSVRWVCASSGTQPLPVPASPSWPVPPDYITSAFLNANVRDAIRFLIFPPIMEYHYATFTTSLASATSAPAVGISLSLGLRIVDNYSAYSGNTWTAPVAGTYFCYGQCGINANSTGVSLGAGLTVTSANYNAGSPFTIWGGTQAVVPSTTNSANVSRRLRLNAADTINLAGFQRDSAGSSASLDASDEWVSRLVTVWECA